ncbi:hypothetical protein [Bacillus wiedmannii]|uniref:hypothetical protein n=1 Tax=Bacillus wiedmannii TaxID=1890302 RepID=UPI0016714FC4|nr:hypothetical protein [Bacillus wiedmannii]
MITVQDLINVLQKIEDKSKEIIVDAYPVSDVAKVDTLVVDEEKVDGAVFIDMY